MLVIAGQRPMVVTGGTDILPYIVIEFFADMTNNL